MKNIIKHTKLGMNLAALAFSLAIPQNAQAQSCATPPSCTELGYIHSESECATTPLKCPFDKTKCHCLTADELSAITPPVLNCAIGDILYSDKTCNANVVASKTPIGVVFDATNRLAVALKEERKKWSVENFEIPDLPISSSGTETGDWQGKNNTSIIVAYCKNNNKSCPAFDYVNTYSTAGTKAGDWYLPAMGELNAIFNNLTTINNSLSKIGGTKLDGGYLWWSSSVASQYFVWNILNHPNINSYQTWTTGKTSEYEYWQDLGYSYNVYHYTRPVLAF